METSKISVEGRGKVSIDITPEERTFSEKVDVVWEMVGD